MTANRVREKIAKLEQMTTARGATSAEAANAQKLIAQLRIRMFRPEFFSWEDDAFCWMDEV
jgi:hypothetical protein